jgi:hypothetical protein
MSGEKNPAGHAAQMDELDEAYEPALHGTQDDAFAEEKCPLGQDVQFAEPMNEKEPAEHGTQ